MTYLIRLIGVIVSIGLFTVWCTPLIASEVTGTLSAGASIPTGGSLAEGQIGGGVGISNTISGTVTNGGASNSGGGNSSVTPNSGGTSQTFPIVQVTQREPIKSVLGISITQNDTPLFPNTGIGDNKQTLLAGILVIFLIGLLLGLLVFKRKKRSQ